MMYVSDRDYQNNSEETSNSAHLKLVSLVVSWRQLLPRAQSSMNDIMWFSIGLCEASLEQPIIKLGAIQTC